MEFPLQITNLSLQALESFRTELPSKRDSESEMIPSERDKNPSIPHLYFLRDDLLPLGFGTKWRKVQGIIEFLKENQIRKVLLWGGIHGNYLASFTYLLRLHGIKVDAIAYTRDPQLKTYNETIVRGHSHSIECYANRATAYAVWLERQNEYPGLVLPEFGIHPSEIPGLQSLWEKLKKEIRSRNHTKAILVLEIGSGATFLSAFDVFQDSSILVLGVMVGEPKEKWIPKIADLQKQLGLKNRSIPSEQILELPSIASTDGEIQNRNANPEIIPKTKKISGSFAKKNKTLLEWIGRFYRSTNILLEPVYSGNTVYSLLREIYEMQLLSTKAGNHQTSKNRIEDQSPNQFLKRSPNGQMIPIFYLHQGGQIQHLDLILEKVSK
ncbi:hypothetical protein JWG41_09220 [Leptospira sp. 201903075]|nr:hypothetical protein [Leptospira chreensis]